MTTLEIGLFPLDLVLVPGENVPLHIFEDRYKDLIGSSLDSGDVFGIVLADEDGMRRVGTTARVGEVRMRYPDGRMDIVATGAERFSVLELTESISYVTARVDTFEDDDSEDVLEVQIENCISAYRSLADEVGADTAELDTSQAISFQIMATVDLGTSIKQEFLELRSESDRLAGLTIALRSARDAVARHNEIARKASGNGHVVSD